ncbi:MAG: hypothetical protein KGI91_15165 [Burkholderiales bacterium]|nr:hypothetical protein [Burkholderiales bacterium]MDE2078389.1 hypothetical protein [Burkholderiales bacterium]MDE2433402.1 hypothetical protein [Burkholderiales bacterium]
MRRWIAILLMIVLPLQLSWAVASNYCQDDEQGAQVQHFGHHLRLHQDGGASKHLVKGKQQADRDCGCGGHLCGAHLLPTCVNVVPPATVGQQLSPVAPWAYAQTDPTRIERPNWPASL